MTKKIFRSMLTVAVVVFLLSLSLIVSVLYQYYNNIQTGQLQDELHLAAAGTESGGESYLSALSTDDCRLTWIAADGSVLFDSEYDTASLENHAARAEVRDALLTGSGSSIRYSATRMERTVYEAVRLSDGSVLRISMAQMTPLHLVLGMLHPVLVVIFIAIVVSLLLSHQMATKIVNPLNDLDLEKPLSNNAYEELSPLLRRINQQNLQIDAQMRKLRRKTDEFIQITSHMQEGLVVLDKETNIRSINSAAMAIFRAEEACVGTSFFRINRSTALRQALNDALDRGHGSTVQELDGRAYRLDMSAIQSEGKLLGAVILAVDVTESRKAEQMRREFSANVSHELKTPLQGILGSAELMESGLVKTEDMPRFVGHIRKEAARLVNLIGDIIRLSQLDEGVELPTEAVDILAVAEDVKAILDAAAAEKQVEITVSGEGFAVQGVRRMLHEMVYNLCENAIKYNVPGGKVAICAQNRCLSVSDTGIGIPAEHHDRIFERFYRVDKSHSKETGGTGLGLSIVKRAAAHHKAQLRLESTPGKGTTITIQF